MSIGIWQLVLVLVIVLLLFGAGKLPRVMGDLAKGMKNFKQNLKDGEETESVDAGRTLRSDSTVPPASPQATQQATASKEEAKG